MERGFWSTTPEEIGHLNERDAVSVLRNLLCAEAGRYGIPLTDIDVPSEITIADGGIDAEVRSSLPKGTGVLFPGLTRYQVKTGRFALDAKGTGARSVLLKPGARKKAWAKCSPDDLLPRVRHTLDCGGTLVICLFGSDAVQRVADGAARKLKRLLGQIRSSYSKRKLIVWPKNVISNLVNDFPAVALPILNFSGTAMIAHQQWARREDMRRTYVPGGRQSGLITELRSQLAIGKYAGPIRILGEPGIGKTRLVLEALRADGLAQLTLYAGNPGNVDAVLPRLALEGERKTAILVADECPLASHVKLRDALGHIEGIRIITIFQEEHESDASSYFMPSLEGPQIEEILRAYVIQPTEVERWANLCEGSPRIAHLVGENLRQDPSKPLRNRDELWDRCIAGRTTIASEDFRKRKLILSSIALFKRFGWDGPVAKEAVEVFEKIVRPLDHTISLDLFRTTIRECRRARILQGDSTLYFSPKLLHIWLWKEWWDAWGNAQDFKKLFESLSNQLQRWLVDMVEYAKESEALLGAINQLYGPNSIFRDLGSLKKPGVAELFFNVARAIPERAIEWLEGVIEPLSPNDISSFSTGRRDVVESLGRIALRSDLFFRAAMLLARLAEGENESWANNATGTFLELFSLGYGPTGTSEIAPRHRLPVLERLLERNSRKLTRLALDGFDRALGTTHFRLAGIEVHGLRDIARPWQPRNAQELWDEYRVYWTRLRQLAETLPSEHRPEAIRILLSHARGLIGVKDLAEDVLRTLEDLARNPAADREAFATHLGQVIRYERKVLRPRDVERLSVLRDKLVGDDFDSLARRYLGMDLLEDHFDDAGNHYRGPNPKILELARQATATPDILQQSLSWLVSRDAKNAFHFGYELGAADADETKFWPQMRDAWIRAEQNAGELLLGGYLKSVFERSPQEWTNTVLELADTAPTQALIGVIWRSGMSERVAAWLIDAVKAGKFDVEVLHVFAFGGASKDIPAKAFKDWITTLIASKTFNAARIALELLAYRGDGADREIVSDLIEVTLFNPMLLKGDAKKADPVMLEHYWVMLAKKWAGTNPSRFVRIAECVLEQFGTDNHFLGSYRGESTALLSQAVKIAPREVWPTVAKLLEPPLSGRSLYIGEWLRGDRLFRDAIHGSFDDFRESDIVAWADNNRRRKGILARFLPLHLDRAKWPNSLARKILKRYANEREVLNSFGSNFFSEGWSGPASLHYARKKKNLEELAHIEHDQDIRRWFTQMTRQLDDAIERARIDEERHV